MENKISFKGCFTIYHSNGTIIESNLVGIDYIPENTTVAGMPAKIISRGEKLSLL